MLQAEGIVFSIQLSTRWHYQTAGTIDLFREHELMLWILRREQLRAMHALLVQRIDLQTRQNVEGFYLTADNPADHHLALLPPPYQECSVCGRVNV